MDRGSILCYNQMLFKNSLLERRSAGIMVVPAGAPLKEHNRRKFMSNHENVQVNADDVAGQIGEFLGRVPAVIGRKLRAVGVFRNRELMQQVIRQPDLLDQVLHDLYTPKVVTSAEWHNTLEYWADLYKRLYNMVPELGRVRSFEHIQPGYRVYIVAQGLIQNAMIEAMRSRFPVSTYTNDLDADIREHDQHPRRGSYAIAFRDVIEADEDLKNLSADQLRERGVNGITTFERFLMEDEYHNRTKGHLDQKNWTLCAGSRDRDGRVPGAGWGVGRFHVGWSSTGCHDPGLRAREAVFPL